MSSNNSNGFSSAELQNGRHTSSITHLPSSAPSTSIPEGVTSSNGNSKHASNKSTSQTFGQKAKKAGHFIATKTSGALSAIVHVAQQTGASVKSSVDSCLPSSSRRNESAYSAIPTEENDAEGEGEDETAQHTHPSRSPKWTRRHPALLRMLLSFLGLLVLFLLAIGVILLHLFLSTLRSPSAEIQKQILDSSILLKGPDNISLLNISDSGISVAISGRLGLDPDHALDLWLGEKQKLSAWKKWDRSWIEWALDDVKAVKVEIGEIRFAEPDWSMRLPEQELDLIGSLKGNKSRKHDHEKKKHDDDEKSKMQMSDAPIDLLSFHVDPLLIPIPRLRRSHNLLSLFDPTSSSDSDSDSDSKFDSDSDLSSTPRTRKTLHPIHLELLFKPSSPAEQIISFVNSSLTNKKLILDLKVASVSLKGLDADGLEKEKREEKEEGGEFEGSKKEKKRWFNVAKFVNLKQGEVRKRFSQKIPKLDNSTDTSHLLDLDGYEFFEIKGGEDDGGVPTAQSTNLGSAPSPSELVRSLVSDRVRAMGSRALGIKAHAVAKNPLGKLLKGYVQYSIPFGVFLPVKPADIPAPGGDGGKDDGKKHKAFANSKKGSDDDGGDKAPSVDSVLMAVVAAEPFELKGKKEVKLDLLGRVVPPPTDALPPGGRNTEQLAFSTGPGSIPDDSVHTLDNAAQVALSGFLSKFLRGEANTVIVHGGNPFLDPGYEGEQPPADLPGGGSLLPGWFDNALRQVQLPISFPGSKVTDLIKNVSISDLQIHPHPFEREKLLCDGTITGVMELPGQLATVDVMITDLWPDIIVYNGKPPSMRHGDEDDDDDESLTASSTKEKPIPEPHPTPDPAPPLPNPLPKHAFGRVRPHDFTAARTYVDPEDPEGRRKLLHCELKGVPFEVLPGRSQDFRSFSWKVLTGAGALAGIEGSARAKIWNSGLGKLELSNLPVKGAFVVGKRGGDGDDDGDDDRW